VFEDLFLSGKADALPAIEALALYYDFSKLTPIGRRGDELIRRLSERLVAVDLLDQASELLAASGGIPAHGCCEVRRSRRALPSSSDEPQAAESAVAILAATRLADLPKDTCANSAAARVARADEREPFRSGARCDRKSLDRARKQHRQRADTLCSCSAPASPRPVPAVDQHEEDQLERQRDTTTGGSIIMPIDISTEATTMSMMTNGRNSRKPISKARRSSEIMKAGTRMRSDIAAASAGGGSPDMSMNSCRSFSRTFFA
jgi:hypothetical protein